MDNFINMFTIFKTEVEKAIANEMPPSDSGNLAQKSLWPGNRLRPMFVLFAYNRNSDIATFSDSTVYAAAAIECVHRASLLLDDMIDSDILRRGTPTFWNQHGQPLTALTASYLMAVSGRLIHKSLLLNKSGNASYNIYTCYNKMINHLFSGAVAEQCNWPHGIVNSMKINVLVSAYPIKSCYIIGRNLSNNNYHIEDDTFSKLLLKIGLLFQNINDLRQFDAKDNEVNVKGSCYSDLRSKSNNIVISLAYRTMEPHEKIKFTALSEMSDPDAISEMVYLIAKTGAIEKVKQEIKNKKLLILDMLSNNSLDISEHFIFNIIKNMDTDEFWTPNGLPL